MNKIIERRKRRKRRNKIIKNISFGLFFIILLSWLIFLFINTISNLVFNHDENLVINKDAEMIETINITAQAQTLYNENSDNDVNVIESKKSTIDYSIKPDALDDIYFEWIVEISENEEVPLEVLLAIITTENTTYDVNATYNNSNGTSDMGLCQINSAYLDYFAETYDIPNLDPYNVYDAVTFVARHMKYLSNYAMSEYNLLENDSYIFAAGAYNRGLSNECKYRNMYHYKEKFLINYNKFI